MQPSISQALAAVLPFACLFAGALAGGTVNLDLTTPTLDRWNYPFANNPGGSHYAAVFGALTSQGFHPDFDNRDGQMIAGYDTATAGITPNLGQWAYTIRSASVRLTVESDKTFGYDPTPDSYRIWLPTSDPEYLPDRDPGHAVEVFGVAFRYGFSATTYGENAPYSPVGPFGKGIRTAYPIAFENGQCIDVSNNVDARFDPNPFGVGINPTLTPGQPVPLDTELQFEINVGDPDIQRYLRRALNEGMLDLCIASIFPAEQQQTGTYPRFYTKEHLAVQGGLVSAARLAMTVAVSDTPGPAGDVDGNGVVNVDDLLAVVNAWGPCSCCAADVNYDNLVNVDDLLIVINTWG
jgi:hypothetical protein